MTRLLPWVFALLASPLPAASAVPALSPPETLEQAAYSWRNGDGRNAELWLLNALAKDPGMGKAQLLLGLVYASEGRSENAEEELKLASLHAELVSDACHNLGTLYFKNGRYQEAGRAFERALQAQPDRADSLLGLGILELKLENWAGAEKAFGRCLRQENERWQAWAGLGESLSSQGKAPSAVEAWRQAQRFGSCDEICLKFAGAQFAAGDIDGASKSLSSLKQPDTAPALYLAGCVASQQGKLDQAFQSFEDAARKDPSDSRALLALAVTCYDRREYEQSLALIQKVLTSKPENMRAIELRVQVTAAGVEDLLNEAGSAVMNGRITQARLAALRATGLDPGNAAARELAQSLLELESNQVEKEAGDQAARAAESDKRAARYAELGTRSFEKGDWTEAKKQLSQALSLGAAGEGLKGMLSQARAKARLALDRTTKPVRPAVDPVRVRQLYLQGVYAYAGGDTQKAVLAWREVLKMDPGHLQAKDAMEEASLKLEALERLKKKA